MGDGTVKYAGYRTFGGPRWHVQGMKNKRRAKKARIHADAERVKRKAEDDAAQRDQDFMDSWGGDYE